MVETARRQWLAGGLAAAGSALAGPALGQAFPFKPNQRYPDPSVEILDPSFGKYRIYSSTVEQVATGMRWAEGPACFPEGRYVFVSDIPNNRIMKYDEVKNSFTVFRSAAPISASVSPRATGSTRRAATRSTRFMWRLPARSETGHRETLSKKMTIRHR